MLKVNNKLKQIVLAMIDTVIVGSALYIALLLRFEGNVPAQFFERFETLLWPAVAIHLGVFFLLGIYRRLWRYASVDELLLVVFAVSVGTAGTFVFSMLFDLMLPRSVYVIFWFLMLCFVGGSRLFLRVFVQHLKGTRNGRRDKPVLVIGAGDAGVLVAGELKKFNGVKPVGFIDDDPNKRHQVINGLPVLGGREELSDVVHSQGVEEVVIAMPSVPYRDVSQFVKACSELPVKMKTVPGIYEFIEGNLGMTNLKEVEVEDLLKREPVVVDIEEIAGYLSGKTVLVTGAGGSIGSELCRQVVQLGPRALLLLDHDENGIFYIHQELEEKFPGQSVYPLIRNVAEKESIEKVLAEYRPQVIFHAAAHKHVPLMESNLEEAVKNNLLASIDLMDLAGENGVEHFVYISTDKAVNPSSIMGATKRAAEIYLQQKAVQQSSCVFCAVRFGNVLGSRGSVVPLFKDQIVKGGPVKVTHPDMTRYFMTIPEAVQLVIQAGAFSRSGEVFVLDMGDPVRIVDLARDMIYLSGLEPGRDIQIEFTGVRPGEKLSEELFNPREELTSTKHERIFIAPHVSGNQEDVKAELAYLHGILGVDLSLLVGWKMDRKEASNRPGRSGDMQ